MDITATSLPLTSGSQEMFKSNDVWIGGTRAGQHSFFSSSSGTNLHACNVCVKGQIRHEISTLILIDFLVNLKDIRGKKYRGVLYERHPSEPQVQL